MAVASNGPGRTHPLEVYLGYHLRRAASHMQADLTRRIADLGITIVEMSVLLVVEANPGIIQSDIGRMIAIQRANMAPLVAGLVKRGWVDATPVDKRSSGLSLTDLGVDLVKAAQERIAENEAVLFANIGETDRATVLSLVKKLWSDAEA